MKQASCSHKEHASCKCIQRTDLFAPKPDKAEQDRYQVDHEHVSCQDAEHRNIGQQAADQDIRAQKTIIRKHISVAAASQVDPRREQSVLLKAGVAYCLRKGDVLAQPVCV